MYFYEHNKKKIKPFVEEKKSFSMLRCVNGLPSSTLKVFRLNFLLFFLTGNENIFFYQLNLFTQQFADIVQKFFL